MRGAALALSTALLAVAAQAGPRPAAKTYVVAIDKMKFGAVPASARVGDTIIWVNHDMFRHTATARDKSFSVDLKPGAKGSTRLTKAGAVPFYCIYHPGMKGELKVVG